MKILLIAITVLSASTTFSQSAQDYISEGAKLSMQGDNSGAMLYYTKALNIEPQNYDALYLRGVCRLSQGDNYGAVYDLEQATRINGNKWEAWVPLSSAYYVNNKYLESIEAGRTAISNGAPEAFLGGIYYIIGSSFIKDGESYKGCLYLKMAIDYGFVDAIDNVRLYCK